MELRIAWYNILNILKQEQKFLFYANNIIIYICTLYAHIFAPYHAKPLPRFAALAGLCPAIYCVESRWIWCSCLNKVANHSTCHLVVHTNKAVDSLQHCQILLEHQQYLMEDQILWRIGEAYWCYAGSCLPPTLRTTACFEWISMRGGYCKPMCL